MAAKRDKNKLVEKSQPPKPDAELSRLHIHFVETSWRVAVPILLLTITGIKLDERQGTNPLFSIAGVLLSLLFATLLVYRYLKQNFPDSFGGAE